ncbi:hypothetical protein [Stenotrophomonas sp. PD6]|uniref:hypothetical protein n=1 Tax=Stenotrophomonas sp. PD6 TaxID=3368612 RepID=UPI003BA24A6F
MPIDRTHLASPLIAAARAELAQRGVRTQVNAGSRPATQAPARPTGNLRTVVAAILRGVDVDDPVAMRSARRRVIRAVLLAELGAELREYSQWQPMLDSLVESLEANEVHRDSFSSLIKSVTA